MYMYMLGVSDMVGVEEIMFGPEAVEFGSEVDFAIKQLNQCFEYA